MLHLTGKPLDSFDKHTINIKIIFKELRKKRLTNYSNHYRVLTEK